MAVEPPILPLEVEALRFEDRGQVLIDDISFTLSAGGVSIVLGPNGAGKSLLLRLCHGLLKPSSGRVRWFGNGAAEARQRQSMVFQRPVLLRRSVAANLSYVLRLRGVPARNRAERIATMLHLTGLSRFARRNARTLSGGEQQKLALARAWITGPEVLFLDEPTANLDPAATRSVERIIRSIADSGTKIVMTTHDLGQARRLADEVLFLNHGMLLERARAAVFFESPQHVDARAFIHGDLLW
ncbi:MAG: ATP-binding cassette domain-containing protein [Gammaproteobacteria bacterium]|nr:ATP-binding cassette domain-containing protein [Gammaproteobacteria bacterium]